MSRKPRDFKTMGMVAIECGLSIGGRRILRIFKHRYSLTEARQLHSRLAAAIAWMEEKENNKGERNGTSQRT